MDVTNINIANVDGTVDNIHVDFHDTDDSANDKNVDVDYDALPQNEKDIVDAYYNLMVGKLPA